MRKNYIFGALFAIAGLLIAIGPKTFFAVCASDGEMIMKCFYVAQTEIATWADSDIRKWLNSTFINTYFTQEERAKILPDSIPDKGSTETNTVDKVYLLSKDEVIALLPEESSRQCGSW